MSNVLNRQLTRNFFIDHILYLRTIPPNQTKLRGMLTLQSGRM